MKIPAIKVQQNEKDILIFSISANILREICYFNPREIDRQEGIQRIFKEERSRQIAEYIDSEDSILPNDIIINLELENLGLKLEDIYYEQFNKIDIGIMRDKAKLRRDTFQGKVAFVIDGQHRLRAFKHTSKKKFPLIVAAMIDLSLAEIAEIFVKINYYQVPVNKSHVFDLLGISREIFPQYFELHNVVKRLNEEDVSSPFYGKIKMLGIGKGFISQASMITSIEKYKIGKTLEGIGIKPTEKIYYDITWNFFKSVSDVFKDHWVEGSRLAKTIGIRALVRVMRDLIEKFSKEHIEFSVDEISNLLKKIDVKKILSETVGIGGEKGVKVFYEKMKEQMGLENEQKI